MHSSARRGIHTARTRIAPSAFDAIGRRIKKTVTNAGEYETVEVYFYDGQKIIEIRNGSNAMVQQFIHGTQYIDELVMIRVANKGDLYVHQDANWNVVGLTDLGGRLVERYVYSPYGELTVHQSTGYGARDGDADVDSTDSNVGGCSDPPSGACRIMDLDFDGGLDSADQTLFAALSQGLQRNPGRLATAVSQPFAHQGLFFEPEIGSYQNRARQYDPAKRRFMQRDPVRFRKSPSLYVYLSSDPTASLDPSGLCDFDLDDCLGTCYAHYGECMVNAGTNTRERGECTCKLEVCRFRCSSVDAELLLGEEQCPAATWNPWEEPWIPPPPPTPPTCVGSIGNCHSADQSVGLTPGSPCGPPLGFLIVVVVTPGPPGSGIACCGCQ